MAHGNFERAMGMALGGFGFSYENLIGSQTPTPRWVKVVEIPLLGTLTVYEEGTGFHASLGGANGLTVEMVKSYLDELEVKVVKGKEADWWRRRAATVIGKSKKKIMNSPFKDEFRNVA